MFTITVTPKHINQAQAHRHYSDYLARCDCPISLALKDKFPCTRITVLRHAVCIGLGTGSQPLPIIATEFISRFDHKEQVYPITFQL